MSLALELFECPNCHFSQLILTSRDDLPVLACQSCDDFFQLRKGIACFIRRFDDYTQNYLRICEDDLAEPKTPGTVKKIFTRLVQQRAQPGVTADVGCGDGYVIRSVKSRCKIAVDIALRYLELLPDSVTRIWSFAENLPLKAHSLDTLICTDVLEHVRDASAVAAEIKRLVKPDGRLLLAFPFEQDLSVYDLPEYKAKYGKYKYVHLRSIDDTLIEDLFPEFETSFSHLITEGMDSMEFKPYPIKFIELIHSRA